MIKIKELTWEKWLFGGILSATLISFWYFEESLLIRVLVIILAVIGLIFALRNKQKEFVTSKFELVGLLALFLGSFAIYNALYSINLPLYIAIILILILICGLFVSLIYIDKINISLIPEALSTLVVLIGLVILEVFLSLYFLSIDPEIKSLILVIVFYLITSLIYLNIHSMLRLKKAIGYIIISLLILVVIILIIWLRLPR